MKLLLTSAGLTNSKIVNALLELTELPANKVKVAFVPTASNLIEEDKGWLIDNLIDFKKQGYESIDIVDISAVPKESVLRRFENANVICFGGGNEIFLAEMIVKSGIADELKELLKNRVYMGISAGSMVAGVLPSEDIIKVIYPEEVFERTTSKTLNYVNIHYIPHLNSRFFKRNRKEVIEGINEFSAPVYVCDDQTALKIINDNIEIVGGGDYLIKKI